MTSGYVVVCEDGETRHPGVFATRRDADLWAWWAPDLHGTLMPVRTAA